MDFTESFYCRSSLPYSSIWTRTKLAQGVKAYIESQGGFAPEKSSRRAKGF